MTVESGGYPPEMGPASTLGEHLRNTRIAAGASIEQVEFDLRIKAKYIEAIEDGDTAVLPSRAYTDGFLRNYATYLGLDPAQAVSRFAGEHGRPVVTSRSAKTVAMPKQKEDQFAGLDGFTPKRGLIGSFGRGIAAMWPVALFSGMAFAGYTGFVAARDAGLIPAELGVTTERVAAVDDMGEKSSSTPAQRTRVTESVKAGSDADEDSSEKTAATVRRVELVGSESSTGRPATLSYARAGSTPYWQAKAPALEPADGPVADISPEEAGVLRKPPVESEIAKKSRWSAQSEIKNPTTEFDATRIAAEARKALVESLAFGEFSRLDSTEDREEAAAASSAETPSIVSTSEGVRTAEIEEPTENSETTGAAPFAVEPAAAAPPEPQYGIGPIVTEGQATDFAPAQPTQAPRRFALVAKADTWVQVTDAIGTVTYTGIMSAGEAYSIPAQDGLRLKTGNAGGLLIEVDGQRFGPLGNSGAVMRNVALNPVAVRSSFTLSQAAALNR